MSIGLCKRCDQRKPISEFSKDKTRPSGRYPTCKQCVRDSHHANKEARNAYSRASYYADRPARIAATRAYAQNRVLTQDQQDAKKAKRKERRRLNKEAEAAYAAAWSRNNRPKRRARFYQWFSAKKQAVPVWADIAAIILIYEDAQRLTETTGIVHHVDHIVPLQSPWVCGLHTVANLRAIPHHENAAKLNRWWPDMGDLEQIIKYKRVA